ncbi:MAG: hypothetical protein L6R41_002007 [Letrouitia leprolyta]|nr:MAG: hypothetical protein L6R41_002007 [Letrouitia leprolyta]
MSPKTYTSYPSIPYTSPNLALRILDLHIPTTPPSTPSYTLIYIHGGAFRDPLITSQSILPSLPFLLPSSSSSSSQSDISHNIAAIASLNYRLSPYPSHPTDPSKPDDESRNAKWPDHVKDVRRAIHWLSSSCDEEEEDGSARGRYPDLTTHACILIGHSVGATIAFALALESDLDTVSNTNERENNVKFKAIVGVEGIYDFVALRDAHLEFRDVYEEFTTAALGDERSGGWEKGNVAKIVRDGKVRLEGVETVVLGQSRRDELVEWGQVEVIKAALEERGWNGEDEGSGKGDKKMVSVVELNGGHDEVWEKGEEMARCILLAVKDCIRRDSGQDS